MANAVWRAEWHTHGRSGSGRPWEGGLAPLPAHPSGAAPCGCGSQAEHRQSWTQALVQLRVFLSLLAAARPLRLMRVLKELDAAGQSASQVR